MLRSPILTFSGGVPLSQRPESDSSFPSGEADTFESGSLFMRDFGSSPDIVKLNIMKARIKLLSGDQFLVAASFDDSAVLDDQYNVRLVNRRQPVSDDKGGSTLH